MNPLYNQEFYDNDSEDDFSDTSSSTLPAPTPFLVAGDTIIGVVGRFGAFPNTSPSPSSSSSSSSFFNKLVSYLSDPSKRPVTLRVAAPSSLSSSSLGPVRYLRYGPGTFGVSLSPTLDGRIVVNVPSSGDSRHGTASCELVSPVSTTPLLSLPSLPSPDALPPPRLLYDPESIASWLTSRKRYWRKRRFALKRSTITFESPDPPTTTPPAPINLSWLAERKNFWRNRCYKNGPPSFLEGKRFWEALGHASLESWLSSASQQWALEAGTQKKRRIDDPSTRVSLFEGTARFPEWLEARKAQWQIMRLDKKRRQLAGEFVGDDSTRHSGELPALHGLKRRPIPSSFLRVKVSCTGQVFERSLSAVLPTSRPSKRRVPVVGDLVLVRWDPDPQFFLCLVKKEDDEDAEGDESQSDDGTCGQGARRERRSGLQVASADESFEGCVDFDPEHDDWREQQGALCTVRLAPVLATGVPAVATSATGLKLAMPGQLLAPRAVSFSSSSSSPSSSSSFPSFSSTGPQSNADSSSSSSSSLSSHSSLSFSSSSAASADPTLSIYYSILSIREAAALESHRRRSTFYNPSTLSFLASLSAFPFCPCDIVGYIFHFLSPSSLVTLALLTSPSLSSEFRSREMLWRGLCPRRWVLPSRPRKTWLDIYFSALQREFENARKQADELLLRVNEELQKGDNLITVKKLMSAAESKSGVPVDVNYCSGVVCERNSLLNLAVINRRLKVTRWLVEERGADLETVDRGKFTPLLNAAYNGDGPTVRFLLQKGANRDAIGVTHSSKGFVPDFKGYDAEGWARKFGFSEVANEIKLGIK